MALWLNDTDQAEYDRKCLVNVKAKEAAQRIGDVAAAKKARQANTYLYQEYEKKQIPPPPPTWQELEQAMTLEERVNRIENVLKIGLYSEGVRDD